MKSAVARFGQGGGERVHGGDMDSLRSYHSSLCKYVSGVEPEDVRHVQGGAFCPVLALYGTPRFHSNNGLFIAKKQEGMVVYASCPNCVFDPRMMCKTLPLLVPGSEGARHPWVAYTEENYPRIMELALSGATRTHPAKNKKSKKMEASSSSSSTSGSPYP
jgi:hypothetical protein